MSSSRKEGAKKTLNSDDCRRQRGETALQIRKNKKEEGLAKRRNMMLNQLDDSTSGSTDTPAGGSTGTAVGANNRTYTVADIPQLMAMIQSPDVQTGQIPALKAFRRLLSTEKNPPVQECVDCGVLPILVAFLQPNAENNFELPFEAAWALTNIASTDRTSLVMECGAIPHLVNLLTSGSENVREQAAWCLGNVAGDGYKLRDYALQCGALGPLIQNVAHPANISLLRNCTWSLSNFCRGKPAPSLDVIRQALPVLAAICTTCSDQETIVDATWALSYMSDGDNERIQEVVNVNLIPSFLKMLTSGVNSIVIPALRTLGNIVSGSDSQTQAVVDAGVLPALVGLLTHNKKNIRKETCWMLSNIAAGSSAQLHLLASTPELIPRVLTQMSTAAEWDVRKEATWVISNIATGGSKDHIVYLVQQGSLKHICDLLEVGEARILLVAMEALEAILKVPSDTVNYFTLVDEYEGIEKLENLQDHENNDVYNKAMKILETYFGGAEEESENLTPAVNAGNVFAFGLPAQQAQSNVEKKLDSFNFNPPGHGVVTTQSYSEFSF